METNKSKDTKGEFERQLDYLQEIMPGIEEAIRQDERSKSCLACACTTAKEILKERERAIGIIRSIVDNPKCADNRKDDDFAQGYDFAYDEIRKEIDKLKGEI